MSASRPVRMTWTDNHVWLHKPPLPFFFNAAIAALWHGRLFGIRFAALLAAQCLVVVVFWIGVRFFDTAVAVAAAALVGFNHFTLSSSRGGNSAEFQTSR